MFLCKYMRPCIGDGLTNVTIHHDCVQRFTTHLLSTDPPNTLNKVNEKIELKTRITYKDALYE